MHARSVVVDGEFETYVPVAHVCHAVHEPMFTAFVNVPAAQSVQTRSLVAVPAVETYLPAAHAVHAVHDDAFEVVE